jgi:hypothetical protein
MRTREEVATVLELVRAALNDCEIARRTGIPRGTVRCWRVGRRPNFERPRATCVVCAGTPQDLSQAPYTYLLGLYLGDGCLTPFPRDVYKLRISSASAAASGRARSALMTACHASHSTNVATSPSSASHTGAAVDPAAAAGRAG